MSEGLQGRAGFAKEGDCKKGKRVGDAIWTKTKCQMSSGKEQQHESSGNEREN